MQAIIFKICLLLFLHGGKASLSSNGDGFLPENVMLTQNTTLQMNGDPMILEQLIMACQAHDIACEITRTEDTVALVYFKNLGFEKKNKIIDQFRPIRRDAVLQWNGTTESN
ncbi:MAG: hypothetical protein V4539_16315 [Bacteroidota bacterium]